MKKHLLLLLLCMLTGLSAFADGKRDVIVRPNIVVYMIEDMGWQDLSVPLWKEETVLNTLYNTPNMEILSMQGLKFTKAYTAGHDFGSAQFALSYGVSPWSKKGRMIAEGSISNSHVKDITEVLSDAGYAVHTCWSDICAKDDFLDFAAQAIDDGKPFFTIVNCRAVPDSVCRSLPLYSIYVDAGITDKIACHATYMQSIDAKIGEMRMLLETKSVPSSQTVVIVVSSNSCAASELDRFRNYPLSQGGRSMREGGLRIPLIISSPYGELSGKCRVNVSTLDLMPTIADMAGVLNKIPQTTDGQTLLPLLQNDGAFNSKFKRGLYWHNPTPRHGVLNNEKGYGTSSVILHAHWKLIYYYETGKTEVFNLHDDIFEIVDQSEAEAVQNIRKRLSSELSNVVRSEESLILIRDIKRDYTYPDGKKIPDQYVVLAPNFGSLSAEEIKDMEREIMGQRDDVSAPPRDPQKVRFSRTEVWKRKNAPTYKQWEKVYNGGLTYHQWLVENGYRKAKKERPSSSKKSQQESVNKDASK